LKFELNEAQAMFQKVVRNFAKKEIAPKASELDETGRFPVENLRKMAELDLMGIPIPVEWGGAGADFLSYIIAIEEISRACASTGVILAVHTSLGCMSILNFGTKEQKGKYLKKLAAGEWLAAFALTEGGSGSDASSLSTRAVREGDYYVLNGSKMFITSGGYADIYVTFVRTGKGKGARGITCLLVEKDTPGFCIGKQEKKMGLNASATTQLIFEDARVPVQNRLGVEDEGFKVAMSLLDGGRIGIAAQALGIAQAAYDAALEYSKNREQFGQKICKFQGIQFMLADMATRIDAARLLVYRAAFLRDAGIRCTREASMAKLYATDTAMYVTTEAVQVFGGYGYSREYPVERLMRDAKVTQIYEGTNQIQRIVIARELIGIEKLTSGRER